MLPVIMIECRVMVVGDKGVGKSCLIRRFITGNYDEVRQNVTEFLSSYSYFQETSDITNIPQSKLYTVNNHDIQFRISEQSDLSNIIIHDMTRVDVFLLCFFLSSPCSLFSATTTWMAALSAQYANTPVILAGCQADRRILSPYKKLSVSRERALAFSGQSGALMYVETEAKVEQRSSVTAFEVAALAFLGLLDRQPTKLIDYNASNGEDESPKSTFMKSYLPVLSIYNLSCLTPPHPLTLSSRSASLSSASLTSKSSTLSSTSDSYQPHAVTSKARKKNKSVEMVTIQCQTLNSDKEMEEVEIEVPSNILNKIKSDSEQVQIKVNSLKHRSICSKLKSILLQHQ